MSFNKETKMYEGYIYCITNNVNGKQYIGQTTVTIPDRWSRHKCNAKKGVNDMALYDAMRKYGIDFFKIKQIEKVSCDTKESLSILLNEKEINYIKLYKTLVTENGYNITTGGDNGSIRLNRKVKQYDFNLVCVAEYQSLLEASDKTGIPYSLITSNCSGKQKTAKSFIFCYSENNPQILFPDLKSNINYNKYTHKQLSSLIQSKWTGKIIYQYNLYGEITNKYDNPIDAGLEFNMSIGQVMSYIGTNKRINKENVLLYENQMFDKDKIYKEIKPISVYDLNGNFQMRFVSIVRASEYLGYDSKAICSALKKRIRYKDHLFSYYGELPPETHRRHGREINMVDDSGNVVKEFICVRQIADYYNKNDVRWAVDQAIKNHTKWNDYYWQYKDNN